MLQYLCRAPKAKRGSEEAAPRDVRMRFKPSEQATIPRGRRGELVSWFTPLPEVNNARERARRSENDKGHATWVPTIKKAIEKDCDFGRTKLGRKVQEELNGRTAAKAVHERETLVWYKQCAAS